MIGEIHLKYEDENYYEDLKEKHFFQKFSKLTGNGNYLPLDNCIEAFFAVIQRAKNTKRNYSVRVYKRNDRIDIYFHRFTTNNSVNIDDLLKRKPINFQDVQKIYDFIFNEIEDKTVVVLKKAYEFLEKIAINKNRKAGNDKKKLKKRKIAIKEGERVSNQTVKEIIKDKKNKEKLKALKASKEAERVNKNVKVDKPISKKEKLIALAKKKKGNKK